MSFFIPSMLANRAIDSITGKDGTYASKEVIFGSSLQLQYLTDIIDKIINP